MATMLRVYRAPEEDDVVESPEPSVRIRLGELLPLVAMAQKMNFVWLQDFLDDEVSVTQDLHDVMQNFRGCRPSA
jgi:hypothetical protein